jgi:plasmid rolling circle replication initiator protein Rep
MKNTNKNHKSQQKFSFETINDLRPNGKPRPWNKSKSRSDGVMESYGHIPGLEHFQKKIAGCGSHLTMLACDVLEHGKTLKEAFFCKCRLCVMCQWRKSLVVRSQIMDLASEHLKKYSTDVAIFATFTVVNEKGQNLSKTLDQMNAAWKRLMELKGVKKPVRASFKSLEITYNEERDDYHPHFHAVFMVPRDYFYRSSGIYLTHEEWLRLWKQSMRDDRITQVNVQRAKTKTKEELVALIGEVAKYATKPSSYLFKNEDGFYEADPKVIEELHHALRGRRLISYGGNFSKIRKAKKMIDAEKADLSDIDEEGILKECRCNKCMNILKEELYRWNFEAQKYQKMPMKGQEDAEVFQEEEVVYEADLSEEEEENSADYYHCEEEKLEICSDFEKIDPQFLENETKKEESQQQEIQFKKPELSIRQKKKVRKGNGRSSHSEASLIPLRGPP